MRSKASEKRTRETATSYWLSRGIWSRCGERSAALTDHGTPIIMSDALITAETV